MTFLWFVIGILGYLFIGSIFAGFIKDEEFDTVAIFFWPLVLLTFLGIFAVDVLKNVGYSLVNIFNNFIHEGEENNET